MRVRARRLGLAFVLAACGCRDGTSAAPPASNVFIAVAGSSEAQRPPPGFEGIWIDIVPGVEYRYTYVSGDIGQGRPAAHLNGHPFVVEEDYVVIGPLRYGPLAKGTRVEVRNEGVFADGKLLGPLPEKIPTPAAGE